MGAHSSVVGGSSAGRVRMCPASVKLSEKIPPQPTSPYAKEGTALHTVMEQVLLYHEIGPPPESFIGMVIEGVEITPELYWEKLVPAGEALAELFKQYDVVEFEAETVVKSSTIDGAFGTCDVMALTRDRQLLMADFKFGDGVLVDAEESSQLMFYGYCALEDPDQKDWLHDLHDNVVMAIIQPAKAETLDVWEAPQSYLAKFFAELTISVSAAEKPHLDPNPGDWCRWCPAAPVCPAKIAEAKRLQGIDTETAEGLAEALTLADQIEPWLRKLRKQAHELMDDGAQIPGFKLVRTDARRKWIDEDGAKRKLKNAKGIVRADYVKETMVSPPQLEKLCKQKGVDFSVFSDYYDAVSGGTAVVPESSPKPAITNKAGKVDLTRPTETEMEQ